MTYSMEAYLAAGEAFTDAVAAQAGSAEFAAARVRFDEALAVFWKGEDKET
ncbi:unnamed protein product [marine sediment metagenome]|uniref:Uncharacterized protein n=1 Tax=marine sediment metagenome TaxID=412755 RepID=X0RY68_9ZZZZ